MITMNPAVHACHLGLKSERQYASRSLARRRLDVLDVPVTGLGEQEGKLIGSVELACLENEVPSLAEGADSSNCAG
jgi:hypothetical protein